MRRTVILSLLSAGLLAVLGIVATIQLHHAVKVSLENATASELDAQARFTGVRLNLLGGRMSVGRIELESNRQHAASWKRVVLENAELDFAWWDLLAGSTPADLNIHAVTVERAPETYQWISPLLLPASGQPLSSQWPHWNLRSLKINNASITDPSGTIHLHNLAVENYDLSIATIQYGEFVFEDTRMTSYWEPPVFRVDHFTTHYGKGEIKARGRWNAGDGDLLEIDYQFDRVPARVFLSEQWKLLFAGNISGEGRFTGPLLNWQCGASQGRFEAGEARIQAFPVLENLSLFTGISGLTSLHFDTVRADLDYHDRQFDFSNMLIRKGDTLRWEGRLSVLPDQSLQGETVLGLHSKTTDLIPPLKDSIFTDHRDGYDWTPVTLSGTIEDPREDLSPRLKQILQQEAGKAVKEGGQLLEKGIEKAKEWLDEWLKKE